jgi:hypothetical protein
MRARSYVAQLFAVLTDSCFTFADVNRRSVGFLEARSEFSEYKVSIMFEISGSHGSFYESSCLIE